MTIPLSGNFWKVNYDVAIRPLQSVIAIVCRNAEAEILFVWTKSLPPGQPLSGGKPKQHFLLRKRHIYFLMNMFCLKVIIFLWLKLLILLSLPSSGALIRPVISNVHWNFHHVNSKSNIVVHNIAQWAAHQIMFGNIPTSYIPVDCVFSDNPTFPPQLSFY